MKISYQDIFQCLKGVGEKDLSSFVLPVGGTAYALCPINCNPDKIDMGTVRMLTEARNENASSFLTYFTASPDKTLNWLAHTVANDDSRILFALVESGTGELYGYMGLAYGDSTGSRIEGDAIVRYRKTAEPGLMKKAFLQLIQWIRTDMGIEDVWVRVLADNPAVDFYKRCGFVIQQKVALYERHAPSGQLKELSELPMTADETLSKRSLVHMRYLYGA